VGPIEYVELIFDDQGKCNNFAWVVFKHQSSVEDSIKLFHGTKLYGLPIVTKKYSKHLEDPVFNDELTYFKQLINVKRSSQSNNDNKSQLNDQYSDNKINIPDSLPEPPGYNNKYNLYQDNNDLKSDTSSSYNDESSKYQHYKSNYTNDHNSIDKSHHNRGHYRKRELDHNFDVSNNDRDSYYTRNYDHNYRNYNDCTSSNWKESPYYYNHDMLMIDENNSVNDALPVQDLKNTIQQKKSNLHLDVNSDTNPKTTSYSDKNSHNKSFENCQEYNNECTNSYSQGKNRFNSKYSRTHPQHLESSTSQRDSDHSYKRNKNYKRKKFKKSYNEHRERDRDRNYNKDVSD